MSILNRVEDVFLVLKMHQAMQIMVISNKHDNGPPESRSGEVAIRVAFSKLGVASGSLASCVLEGKVPMNRPIQWNLLYPLVLMTCRTTWRIVRQRDLSQAKS